MNQAWLVSAALWTLLQAEGAVSYKLFWTVVGGLCIAVVALAGFIVKLLANASEKSRYYGQIIEKKDEQLREKDKASQDMLERCLREVGEMHGKAIECQMSIKQSLDANTETMKAWIKTGR